MSVQQTMVDVRTCVATPMGHTIATVKMRDMWFTRMEKTVQVKSKYTGKVQNVQVTVQIYRKRSKCTDKVKPNR